MTIITKGMGAIIKGGKKIVKSKLAKSKKKTPGEEHFDTVYKLDKTGKKDRMIETLNKKIKHSVTKRAGQREVDEYHRIMTKGSKYSPKFWKDK